MKQLLDGKIASYNERTGEVTIKLTVDQALFLRENPHTALVRLYDSRKITDEQRKMAYALIGEIADWVGEEPEVVKKQMKLTFKVRKYREMLDELSLSDCEQSTASEFIRFLVEIVLEYGVPTHRPLTELCEDIEHAIYACLLQKKCIVCGRKAELHHVDQIGMGNSRKEVEHIGRESLPLCPIHHDEYHLIGATAFAEKYHVVYTVKIDKKIAKVYRLPRQGKGK